MHLKSTFINNFSRIILLLSFLIVISNALFAAQDNSKIKPDGTTAFSNLEDGKKTFKDNLIAEKIAGLTENSEKGEVTLPLILCLEVTLTNNLDIRIEQIDIPLSQKVIVEKEAHFDPVIFGEISGQRYEHQTSSALSGTPISKENELVGIFGIKKPFKNGLEAEISFENIRYRSNSVFEGLDPQYQSYLILGLCQPLLKDRGAAINLSAVNIAQNNLKISSNKFTSQIIYLLNKTEQTYYDLSRAIEALKLRKESLTLAKELLAGNRSRFKAGVTHIGEVQEAETAEASRREQVILARQQLKDVTNILKNILQIRSTSPLFPIRINTEELIPPGKKLPGFQEAFLRALANRPDLRQRKMEIENRKIQLKFNKNQLLPRLDLVGTFGLNGLSGHPETVSFGDESSRSPFGGDYLDSLDHLSEGDGYEWQVGLVAEFPLGNRADRSRYDQSRLEKKRAILELKNLEEKIALEVKIALENIESSRGRFQVAETFEELAVKTLRQEEERMKRGLSNTFRILDFQENLTDAKIRKASALTDYYKAVARLFKAMGTNFRRHQIHLDL